jgi:hypothetical protein
VRNLDLKRTIRRNLHNYDQKSQKLLVDRLYFYGAEKKNRPWHICVVVDQSGSMLDSAIYSTVMAAIFARLPALRTNLVLYDTEGRRHVRARTRPGRRADERPTRRRQRHAAGVALRDAARPRAGAVDRGADLRLLRGLAGGGDGQSRSATWPRPASA